MTHDAISRSPFESCLDEGLRISRCGIVFGVGFSALFFCLFFASVMAGSDIHGSCGWVRATVDELVSRQMVERTVLGNSWTQHAACVCARAEDDHFTLGHRTQLLDSPGQPPGAEPTTAPTAQRRFRFVIHSIYPASQPRHGVLQNRAGLARAGCVIYHVRNAASGGWTGRRIIWGTG